MSSDRIIDCTCIALSAAALALFVRPFQNLPFLDDWTYAWSVARLLEDGDLRLLEWSTSSNFAQVLWGALFCLPFGFSFAALRVSTAVLAVGALCAFYLLLRELDVGRRVALLGTATLGLNPVFFILSWTFMTDVPLVFVMIACAAAVVRGIRRDSRGWLAVATALGCMALAVRNVGIAVPAALAATLAFDPRLGARRHPVWLACMVLAPCLVLAGLAWWTSGHVERTVDLQDIRDAPATRLRSLQYAIPMLPASLVSTLTATTGALGLALLPLSAASVSARSLRRIAVFTALAAACFAVARLTGMSAHVPLGSGSFWALEELGLTRTTVSGYEPSPLPWWWPSVAIAIVATSFAVLLAAVYEQPRLRPGESFLWWLAGAELGLVAVFWLFHDRYLLVVVPVGIALLLSRRQPIGGLVPVFLLIPFAIVSLFGLRDQLAYNRGLWQGVEILRRAGARDSEIDGGYVVNGWLQYAHPEHAPRDARGDLLVPHLTDTVDLRYKISSRPLAGWRILKTVAVERWLGPDEKLYVLENGDSN